MCKSRTSLTVRNFSFPAGKCEQFTAKELDCETKRPNPSQSKHLETATMKIEVGPRGPNDEDHDDHDDGGSSASESAIGAARVSLLDACRSHGCFHVALR